MDNRSSCTALHSTQYIQRTENIRLAHFSGMYIRVRNSDQSSKMENDIDSCYSLRDRISILQSPENELQLCYDFLRQVGQVSYTTPRGIAHKATHISIELHKPFNQVAGYKSSCSCHQDFFAAVV